MTDTSLSTALRDLLVWRRTIGTPLISLLSLRIDDPARVVALMLNDAVWDRAEALLTAGPQIATQNHPSLSEIAEGLLRVLEEATRRHIRQHLQPQSGLQADTALDAAQASLEMLGIASRYLTQTGLITSQTAAACPLCHGERSTL
jgi:hypothetical protein